MADDKSKQTVPYNPAEEIHELHGKIVGTFQTGRTKDIAWRKWQLKQLWWMIEDNEQDILDAINLDLNRPNVESSITDLVGIRKDILYHLEHIDEWTVDEFLGDSFFFKHLRLARLRKEPLGVALIIGAWNFPMILVLQPLVAAITAGCCAIVKPSELALKSQNLLKKLFTSYLDTDAIGLVCGGVQETTEILGHRFNHIFFTGSANVGRIISAAAAKHLTPVTMELGGQSPAIVCKSANVDRAAKSVAYAKFLNAGQICLTVNHALVDTSVYDEFVERMKYWNRYFLGEKKEIETAIVNHAHFDRLLNLLHKCKGDILFGGIGSHELRKMQPTIVDVGINDPLLNEEIFGPICPVVKTDVRTALAKINQMEYPLALYIFSEDKNEIEDILNNTNSGGVTVNDVILHAGVSGAPFGGVGGSGHGYYHGRYGFLAFTHLRTIMRSPKWFDQVLSFRYPPYKSSNIPKKLMLKANFKRGEGIEDQCYNKRSLGLTQLSASIVISMLCLALYNLRNHLLS